MVIVDPTTQQETRSDILTLETRRRRNVIRIPESVQGPPFTLDEPGANYILTKDVTADSTAFVITGPNVTLDLDGHTIIFGNNTL